jgi:hypothetical protein
VAQPPSPHEPQEELAHKEQEPLQETSREEQMPTREHHAEEDGWKEAEIRKKHPIHVRPIFVPMKDVTSMTKWYAHDQFKPENLVKEVPKQRVSEEGITSKPRPTKKYPNMEGIKWTKQCPKIYQRGKNFLPNRIIQDLPVGMRKFHDWYLHACKTDINVISACFPDYTFGFTSGVIGANFDDIQTVFHLGEMDANLVHMWCL